MGRQDSPDDVERVEREVAQCEAEQVYHWELVTRGIELAHEVGGEVPPIEDAHGEERREEDDAVDPLRPAARVASLVEEPVQEAERGESSARKMG